MRTIIYIENAHITISRIFDFVAWTRVYVIFLCNKIFHFITDILFIFQPTEYVKYDKCRFARKLYWM